MAAQVPTTERSGRFAGRLLAFGTTAVVVGVVLAFAIRSLEARDAGAPAAPPVDSPPAMFRAAEPTPRVSGPRRDSRIPLYLVSSEVEKRRMERALVANGYIELNGGDFAGPWAVLVMAEGITLRDVEHMNIARMAHGELPFKVIDARSGGGR